MTGTQSALILCTEHFPSSVFLLICPTSPFLPSSPAKFLLPTLTKHTDSYWVRWRRRKKDGEREVRGDGMRVFCHMTAGSKRRQRGLRACACVSLFLHTEVYSSVCLFTLWLSVQRFAAVELVFVFQCWRQRKRKGSADIWGIWTNRKGEYCLHGAEGIEEGKRREKHSCGMISTVFVIRIRNMCLSLCVFVLLTYWQECLCSRWIA